MGKALRLLLVEDQQNDAILLLQELDRIGYEVEYERVETREAMAAALAERSWDLIICDFSLPTFNAPAALALCKEHAIDIPFIIVSGTIQEEDAVESMRLGAYDFITKNRTARLGPAISRGLHEWEERQVRRAAEARLAQVQRMEAVGLLAGGVAHDFNNLLGVIHGYGELLSSEFAADGQQKWRLDQILHAASRGAALTRQLLALCRQQASDTRPIDLNAVVTDVVAMLRRVISEDIEIVTTLESNLHPVKADPCQIEQVLVNVVINARDAMTGGGRLSVETTNVELNDAYVMSHPDASPGRHAMLTVTDTGHGMDRETLSRIFEPFFTMKEPGKGTGLGLATVYGIVRQSAGHVSVDSERGRGTTFRVYLPRTDEAVEAAPPSHPRETGRTGSETVLLVEDEPALRALVHELLSKGGYTVIDGPTPEASLVAAEHYAGSIDLVVTDLVMPGMSGVEAAARVLAARPEVKVLYISGYATTAVEHQGSLPGQHAFLPKPFGLSTLLSKVREVLDTPLAVLDARR